MENVDGLQELFQEANRQQRMFGLYDNMYRAWTAAGVCWFPPSIFALGLCRSPSSHEREAGPCLERGTCCPHQHTICHTGAQLGTHAGTRSPPLGTSGTGGGLFAVFTFIGQYSKWGSWGQMEHQMNARTADVSPKYAVANWILNSAAAKSMVLGNGTQPSVGPPAMSPITTADPSGNKPAIPQGSGASTAAIAGGSAAGAVVIAALVAAVVTIKRRKATKVAARPSQTVLRTQNRMYLPPERPGPEV